MVATNWRTFPVKSKLTVQRRLHKARYRDDPVAWVQDCLDWRDSPGPTEYQQHILASLVEKKRVTVRAPRGAGKTAPAAWACLWYADTRDGEPWKVPTTAGSWLQLFRFMWPEIHYWAGRQRWDRLGREPYDDRRELLALRLSLTTGEAFAINSDDSDLLEGAHAENLLAIVDEGKAVPDQSWDAIEGYFSDPGEKLALALSIPGGPSGRFHDIHMRRPGFEDWFAIHVTLNEAIRAGRITQEWANQRKLQWGENSVVYRTQVLAEFGGTEDGIIPLAWVEAAMDRWDATDFTNFTPSIVGVDVADQGADDTCLALRHGDHISKLVYFTSGDPLITADRVHRIAPHARAVVDSIGLGAGTLAQLRRLEMQADGFVASAKSKRKDETGEFGFINLRAAGWWNLRELLDPANGASIALPRDDRLLGDLTAPTWREVSGGRIQVESKDDIRKRIGRSTDSADAVVMAFWDSRTRSKLDGWDSSDLSQESAWTI